MFPTSLASGPRTPPTTQSMAATMWSKGVPCRAWSVAIEERRAAARIVHRADRRLILPEMLDLTVLESEIFAELIGHPDQRYEGQRGFRIAAPDVGMAAGEPDFLARLVGRQMA